MKFDFKKYLVGLLYMLISILILSLITNILYYYDIINNNIVKYFKMITAILSYFIGGLYIGYNSPNKGYLYGLKESIIIVVILILNGIIFNSIKPLNIIYYLIITICITFGSMIGINKKNN